MRDCEPIPARNTALHELSTLSTISTVVIVVSALYLARDVLIPLSLSVLITFVLAPLAVALRRLGLPRAGAAVAVAVFSFGVILGAGALGTSQISQLAEQLPQYQSNIRDKIRAVKGTTSGSGSVSRATAVITDIGREITGDKQPQPAPSAQTLGSKDGAPVPVEIRSTNSNPIKVVTELLQPILGPLASTGLVILFVILFLLQREDLRDRVIKLLGTKELHRTTEAMDEAASRLSHYFLLQTALNACFGAAIGTGLWLIGVPSPLLWGIFTMLMRFVPYVGSLLAAVLPVALAAAVDPGWTMVAWTVALFAIAEPVMGQMIEPLIFGHHTGLSPVAIVIAATFWTWLWGPIGLILATPLTLCLVIFGQYTKRLEFLRVLLGDQPALTSPESFYQRLIAGDPAEIIDQAERELKETDLTGYYDDVALEGLALARLDVSSGELPLERQSLLYDGVTEIIDGLSEYVDIAPEATAKPNSEPAGAKAAGQAANGQISLRGNLHSPSEAQVLCVGGFGAVDKAAAALFAQLLDRAGIRTQLDGGQGASGLAVAAPSDRTIQIVCVSYVGSARLSHVRYIVRRLRRLFPQTKIVVGLWRMPASDPEVQRIKDGCGADLFAKSFREAIELCVAALRPREQDLNAGSDVPILETRRADASSGALVGAASLPAARGR